MNAYPKIVNEVNVHIRRDRWERTRGVDGNGNAMDHKHCFLRNNNGEPFCKVRAVCPGNGVNNHTNRARGPIEISAQGGFTKLAILKSTQSGFVDFHKCPNTTLPSDTDRFVGTEANAVWHYDPRILSRPNDFNQIASDIEKIMIETFTGPADVGVYSKSVQETLFLMCKNALQAQPAVDKIEMYMPNLHYLPFPLDKIGLVNKDHTGKPDVFFPIDEPHGMIKAHVARSNRSRL